jgi:hypothetical protein
MLAALIALPPRRLLNQGLDEMWHTGAFHTRLRSAVQARGLSLERIRDRLAEQGVAVSVSTLSNWQRGASRPGGDVRRVLRALESVLHVDDGALAALIDDGPPAGRWRELGPGSSPARVKRLRARLGAPQACDLTVVSALDEVMVAHRQWVRIMHSRLVLRADRDGADRHLVFFHTNGQTLPTFGTTVGCAIGRTAVDADAGLVGAELRFAPLARGETIPVEYRLDWSEDDAHYGRWIRTAGMHFELTVRFQPGSQVSSACRVWRVDAHAPHKDVGGVRLIGAEVAHMIEPDPNPGFHGIRWEWAAL